MVSHTRTSNFMHCQRSESPGSRLSSEKVEAPPGLSSGLKIHKWQHYIKYFSQSSPVINNLNFFAESDRGKFL